MEELNKMENEVDELEATVVDEADDDTTLLSGKEAVAIVVICATLGAAIFELGRRGFRKVKGFVKKRKKAKEEASSEPLDPVDAFEAVCNN